MKKTKAIAWLYSELPQLIRSGIITERISDQIKDHYGDVDSKSKINLALAIFAVIGAVCIGLGVILLFAYNWNTFTRFQKTILGFAPLTLSVIFLALGVLKNKRGLGYREGAAVFNMLSVGAALGIISQIYHIYDDVTAFIFYWMILSVGVVYLLSSSITALFYVIGLTVWATFSQNQGGHAVLFWPLAMIILPHYITILKKDPYSSRALWLSWLLCFCFTVAIGICLEKAVPGLWIIIYSVYFAALYFVGLSYYNDSSSFWAKPLKNFGMAGGTIFAYLLTYEFPWNDIGFHYYRSTGKFHGAAAICDYVIAFALTIVVVAFFVRLIKEKKFFEIAFGSVGLLSIICYSFCSSFKGALLAIWIYNLYVLGLGILLIIAGIKENRMGVVNIGMILTAILIFTRFMDPDMSIILRGIVFIFIGICFFVANFLLSKKFMHS